MTTVITDITDITGCPLFKDIGAADLSALLNCLSAIKKHYQKNDLIFLAGQKAEKVGIVIRGSVHVVQEDFWGNRSIFAYIVAGGLFGESFSCSKVECPPVTVIAAEDTDVLLVDYRKIITTCSPTCAFHTGLIKNMLQILAADNIMMTQKMEHITKRSTREKLLSYLSLQALQAGKNRFAIPFNRQELADYLAVDRSALSKELGRMRDEGILDFKHNNFELKEPGIEYMDD